MLITDSQVHIWAADHPDRPWPPLAHGSKPTPHKAVPISAESLLEQMKAAGVDRAVLVPPSWEGERNDVVAAACQRYPERFRYAARLNYHDPGAREFIANWRQQRGMVALQLTFQVPAFQEPLIKGEIDASLDFATNVPFTIKTMGKEATSFLLYDFGFTIFNDTVVVTEETLKTKRKELRLAKDGLREQRNKYAELEGEELD